MKLFEPLAGNHEEELLDHLAADAQLVPYQPGMVLPVQVAPARGTATTGLTGGSPGGPRGSRPARDPARR